jgi:cytochrome c oxidase subunit 2
MDPADYERWLGEPTRDRSGEEDLASRGRDVAVRRSCTSCHPIGSQPGIGPSWAGLYNSWVDLQGGGRVLADEAYLTRSMMEPNSDITLGFKPVMPLYAGVIDAAETAALVEYIKSLRSPVDPGVVLPAATATVTTDAGPDASAEGGTP